MANVRLLRQSIDDYQKRIAAANAQINAGNDAYQAAYGGYAQQTDAYNAQVNAFNQAAQGGGVYSEGGKYFSATTGDPVDAGSLVTGEDGTQTWVIPNSPIMGSDNDPVGDTVLPYIGEKPGAAPVAPADPTAPAYIKPPNLTASNMRELSNPGMDQAQLAMARARGFEGKSSLAGDEMTAPNSAFADPDDPNNLAERGILARVMGGQL